MSDEVGFTTVANAAGMAAYEPGRAKPVSVMNSPSSRAARSPPGADTLAAHKRGDPQ